MVNFILLAFLVYIAPYFSDGNHRLSFFKGERITLNIIVVSISHFIVLS